MIVINSSHVPALVGSAVRARRQGLGLSQEELAWRAGLNRSYLSDVERGARNLSLSTVEKLAVALETSISVLLLEAEAGRAEGSRTGSPDATQVTILLVEDNPRDVELTLRALQKARLRNPVQVARDGVEALAHFFPAGAQQTLAPLDCPHLVLLDLKLPRLDGLEVLRRLKADPRTRPVPVVVLTCSEEGRDIGESRRLGAAAYIVKPVDFERLSRVTPTLDFAWTLQASGSGRLPL